MTGTFGATRRRARAVTLAMAGGLALVLFGTAGQAGPKMKYDDPLETAAAHDFDDEHTHLAFESPLDKINPLILAAMPKGKSYVNYRAPSKCVPGSLKGVLAKVSKRYGPITVNSTYRSKGKNRRVGGRGKSYHLSCRAVDFRVHGSSRGLMSFLRAQKGVGGLKRYRSGFYHIDNGPRRSW